MKNKDHALERLAYPLREDAEAELARTPPAAVSALTVDVLLHELQVHQVELEMQNEALRETMEALEESRDRYAERYSELYEFAPVGYLTLDESQQIVAANLTAATLLGVDRSRLLNWRFDHFVAVADRERWQQLFIRVKNGGQGQSLNASLQHGDGPATPVHVDCRRDDSDGMPFKLRIAITDISERKQLEQQLHESEDLFRSIFDNNLDAILFAGPDGSILDANPEAQRLFGQSKEELRLLGQQGLVDTTDPRFEAALIPHESDGWFRGELTLIGKGGRKFPAELFSSVFTGREGQRMTSMLVRDISERQWKADVLKQAKNAAEQANNAKSRFLAAASHDLRQPLSALSIYLRVLADKAVPAEQKIVANMKGCVAGLSDLLNDLLDLSKLSAGVVKVNVDDFPIANLLDSLESVHQPIAESRGLRLLCVPSRVIVRTDPVLLQRIVGNFIDNALHYTNRGGVVVGCRRRQGKVYVEVRDSGIGIPADKISEVFEEFSQLGDEARNSGSGLGLAIAAKAAALLGLEIQVRSWPGKGSVFAIEIPLGQANSLPALPVRTAALRCLRIALVEDNRLVRDALTMAMQEAGHQVLSTASSDEMLGALGAQPPHIVVSDYRLANGLTGYEAISALRARFGATLPAIIITGDTDPSLLRRMHERGIVVLHKPLDFEELQAYLEDMAGVGGEAPI